MKIVDQAEETYKGVFDENSRIISVDKFDDDIAAHHFIDSKYIELYMDVDSNVEHIFDREKLLILRSVINYVLKKYLVD